jgi:clan AA aspartic protease (TIGR02281 family)
MSYNEKVYVARSFSGWLFSVVAIFFVIAGCLASMLLILLIGGSLIAQWQGERSIPLMLFVGVALSIFPAIIFNGFITWLRQQWNEKARYFETFHFVLLIGNSCVLAVIILWMSATTSQALYQHGSWLFDKEIAQVLKLSEQHPVLRTGRDWVKQIAYLLEDERETKLAQETKSTTPLDPPRTYGLDSEQPRDKTAARPQIAPLRDGFPLSDPEKQAPVVARYAPPAQKPKAKASGTPGREDEIRFHRHGNSPVISVYLGGKYRNFLLDTGASFLSLSTNVAKELGALPNSHAPTLQLHTANGVITARVGVIDKLRLGNFDLQRVTFVLCDSCEDRQHGVIGLLGMNVLRRFLVTIDQENSSLRLQANTEHKFRDQAADLKPFLIWPKNSLKGYTSGLVSRIFKFSGILHNKAPIGTRDLMFRIVYLKGNKTIGHRDFSVSYLNAGERRTVSVQHTEAPAFESYRIELISGMWQN